EEGRHPEGESRIRRGRVPEGGGVGGEEAIMSATRAPSSPGPAERPGPGSDDARRELERRLDADRDDRDGGDSPVVNETSPQTPVRSEVPARASRGSSPIAILTRGWGTGLAWSLRAFLVMAVLGQAVAFAVNLARAPGESAATAAKLGWLYFGWFHHAAVTARLTSVEGGDAGLTAHFGLAMMLGTVLAIAILYKGGRAVADKARGGAGARVLHGMKVAPAYAILPFALSGLLSIDIPIPRNGLVAGSLQMPSWGLSWLVLPLLIAAAAGGAGGLRSGRPELSSHNPWGGGGAGTTAGGGGWGGLSGGGVSASFLCYSKVPTTVSVTPGGLTSERPVVQADFAKAPSGYLAFLLVPALSVTLGGRYAARKRARIKGEAIAMGAASGVVFAVLVVLGSWLASLSAVLSSPTGGLPANASVLIGPAVGAAGLLALLWGVAGGARGGWLGGREFPRRAPLPGLSSLNTRWAEDAAKEGSGPS